MKSLYLVGTHHLDLKGPERLKKFLDLIRPIIICIESDEEGAEGLIRGHNEVKRIVEQEEMGENSKKFGLMLGYEVWVPKEFIERNKGTLLYLYDSQEKEANKLEKEMSGAEVGYSKIINENFIESIGSAIEDPETYQMRTDESYDSNSSSFLKNHPEIFREMFQYRDELAESRIRKAFESASGNLVYIGGTLHFFGDYHNLYDRLKDLNPVKVKLKDIGQFRTSS